MHDPNATRAHIRAEEETLLDIHQLTQAEQAIEQAQVSLRESETRYRQLLESTVDAVVTVDAAGQIVHVNAAVETMFGYERSELIGRLVEMLVPERLQLPHVAYRQGYILDPQVRTLGQRASVSGRRKDGTEFPVDIALIPTLEQGQLRVTSIIRDLSTQRRAERELQESEDRYRDLFENANDLIQSVAPDGRLLYVNRAWREALGYSEQESADLSIFEIIDPESRDHCRRTFERLLRGTTIERVEVCFRARDGRKIQAEGSVNCKFIDGRPAYTRGFFRDVSERKRLEERLRQSDKMSLVGQLAGGVAHNFNNLLTIINGYSEMLLGRLDHSFPGRELVEQIHKAGGRAASLTSQLLAFGQQQILKPEILNLNQLVEDVGSLLHHLLRESTKLVTRLDPDLPLVKVDPGQIEKVLLTLAMKAQEQMPAGGRLTITTGQTELAESSSPELPAGSYVTVAIGDTGSGLDDKTLVRLFEPFYTPKGLAESAGLGLASTYGIVKQSGGHIDVASNPQGTTFTLYFQAVLPSPELDLASLPGGQETILLVEDEEGVRNLLSQTLRMYGYTVLEARDGDEALHLSRRYAEPIHVLATDIIMPNMNGLELAKQLLGLRPHLRVLFLSGYSTDGLPDSPHQAFLKKPFSLADLSQTLRKVLEQTP